MLKFFSQLLDLVYPRNCVSCSSHLSNQENYICINCLLTLPRTNSHISKTELIERKFWGKINIKNTYSFLKFTKKGKVQRILHQLKYQNKPDLAEYMGNWYGRELKLSDVVFDFDLLVGVPLHKDKLRIRGYNQSDFIAKGLSEQLGIPFSTSVMLRNTFTESQTKQGSRIGRYRNIEGVFEVSDTSQIKGKRVALVDDILTTGSTLEVAGICLLEAGCEELSIITIASAY
jgi:ComF family protein